MIPDATGWLQYELKFTDEDLALNRNGSLSETQVKALKDKLGNQVAQTIIFEFASLVCVGIIFGAVMLSQRSAYSDVVGLLITLISLFILYVGWDWIKGKIKFGQQKVESIVGDVRKLPPEVQEQMHSQLSLQSDQPKLALTVPARYFEIGEQYRLYYLKRSKIIVSADKITSHE